MAIVKKFQPKKIVGSKGENESFGDLFLPSEKSVPSTKFEDYTWLIYGRKKIGKTSLIANWNGTLFLPFEPGGKSLAVYQAPVITDWGMARRYVKLLKSEKHSFGTVCIDPGNAAYDRCLEWVCKRDKIPHPGKVKDYGASWKEVAKEFQFLHSRIASSGLCFVVICHEKVSDKENFEGITYEQVGPLLSGSADEFYSGTMDVIAYYHYVKDKRFLQIRGTENVNAGVRCDTPENPHFRTVDGDPVVKIPMGNSSEEAYQNILRAFRNEQKRTYAGEQYEAKVKGKERRSK